MIQIDSLYIHRWAQKAEVGTGFIQFRWIGPVTCELVEKYDRVSKRQRFRTWIPILDVGVELHHFRVWLKYDSFPISLSEETEKILFPFDFDSKVGEWRYAAQMCLSSMLTEAEPCNFFSTTGGTKKRVSLQSYCGWYWWNRKNQYHQEIRQ